MDRVLAQPANHVGKQFTILTEARVSESMRDVLQRRLRHQCQNIEQAIRDFPGSQTFFDKFRDAILCANAGPQAL